MTAKVVNSEVRNDHLNFSNPIGSVIPSSHGPVLEVLARTDTPLTGRKIASLTNGLVSQSQASVALRELVETGVVHRERHPPANLYRLNRDHVAADAIDVLSSLRDRLLGRIRDEVAQWEIRPAAVWIFGSFARGEGSNESDFDILVMRAEGSVRWDEATGSAWAAQLDHLTEHVYRWSGNDCAILEYTPEEFAELAETGERLPADLSRVGVHVAGRELPRRRKGAAV